MTRHTGPLTECICGKVAWKVIRDSFANLTNIRIVICNACGHIPVYLPEGELLMELVWAYHSNISAERAYQTCIVPDAVATVYRTQQERGPDKWLWTSEVCLPSDTHTRYFPKENDAKSYAEVILGDFLLHGEVPNDEVPAQTASEVWRETCAKARAVVRS